MDEFFGDAKIGPPNAGLIGIQQNGMRAPSGLMVADDAVSSKRGA